MSEEKSKRASEQLLGEIHGILAQNWAKKLREAPETITPAEFNTIRQFLKDNGISCDPEANSEIQDMVRALPEFKPTELTAV
jgi:hypothetical protein